MPVQRGDAGLDRFPADSHAGIAEAAPARAAPADVELQLLGHRSHARAAAKVKWLPVAVPLSARH
ncbi:MAG: hypothetical protein CK431_21330 [Mycobacterium sp.]|nr:MAG: hypothetical protein CK431_21330 [Mycobacterium sp.]